MDPNFIWIIFELSIWYFCLHDKHGQPTGKIKFWVIWIFFGNLTNLLSLCSFSTLEHIMVVSGFWNFSNFVVAPGAAKMKSISNWKVLLPCVFAVWMLALTENLSRVFFLNLKFAEGNFGNFYLLSVNWKSGSQQWQVISWLSAFFLSLSPKKLFKFQPTRTSRNSQQMMHDALLNENTHSAHNKTIIQV